MLVRVISGLHLCERCSGQRLATLHPCQIQQSATEVSIRGSIQVTARPRQIHRIYSTEGGVNVMPPSALKAWQVTYVHI